LFFPSSCVVFVLAILGFTVVAIGDSFGDFIADTSVARAGLTEMALASTFGSPLFNEVTGLSLAFLIGCSTTYPNPFVIVMPPAVYWCWAFLGASLISNLVLFPFFRFKPPAWVGFYLIILYACFVVVNILMQAT
jgi:sodium/potassium/calcium exchanger 6